MKLRVLSSCFVNDLAGWREMAKLKKKKKRKRKKNMIDFITVVPEGWRVNLICGNCFSAAVDLLDVFAPLPN